MAKGVRTSLAGWGSCKSRYACCAAANAAGRRTLRAIAAMRSAGASSVLPSATARGLIEAIVEKCGPPLPLPT
jgi:hypothetical protein